MILCANHEELNQHPRHLRVAHGNQRGYCWIRQYSWRYHHGCHSNANRVLFLVERPSCVSTTTNRRVDRWLDQGKKEDDNTNVYFNATSISPSNLCTTQKMCIILVSVVLCVVVDDSILYSHSTQKKTTTITFDTRHTHTVKTRGERITRRMKYTYKKPVGRSAALLYVELLLRRCRFFCHW